MPLLAILLGAIVLAVAYLALAATVCVVSDPSLAPHTKALRILVAWLIPVLGPVTVLWVALDVAPPVLRDRGWLRPLRWLFAPDSAPAGCSQQIDLRADAEQRLPGQTLFPPP